MVPEGWVRESLSDVAKIVDCKHRTPVYVDAGIPLISPGTIKWGALDLLSPVKRVNEEEYESLMDHCSVDIGDLVMSRNQSVGIASYVESKAHFVLGQDTVLIKPIQTDSKFIFYKLQSEAVQRSIGKLAGGSTFSRINLSDIRKLKVNLPPLPEQKKIAKILTTWDKAITTTEQLLASSQQQKKALMQQLLTSKKRLLDKNGKRFSGEWKRVKLSDIGVISSAGVDKKVIDGEKPVRLLNFLDVFRRELISDDDLNHAVTAPDNKVKNCNVLRGDIFFTPSSETRDEVGIPAVAIEDMPGVVYSYHVVRLRPKLSIDLIFSAYIFQSENFRKQAYRLADGSGQRYVLSQDDFRGIEIDIPALDEQAAIGRVLKGASDEIEILQQKLDALKLEKKALMQQLLTGKRRVKVEEPA